MDLNLKDKVVIITGAGGAIGGGFSDAFAREGSVVIVCDVNEKTGRETVERVRANGGKSEFFYLDVTSHECIEKCMKDIYDRYGHIDVLINNAGVNAPPDERHPLDGFSEKWNDLIMNIDLHGLYRCSRAALPYLKKNEHSSIINITSICGVRALQLQCSFVAAKTAVSRVTAAMAVEYAQEGVRVNAIAPGSILFEGTKALFYSDPKKAEALLSHIPMHRPGLPEDVMKAAVFLASDAAQYITGTVMVVDGGWTAGYTRDF